MDFKLIHQMLAQARITWSELASFLKLSAPATADRVRRLEERGVIKGYITLVDPKAVGLRPDCLYRCHSGATRTSHPISATNTRIAFSTGMPPRNW